MEAEEKAHIGKTLPPFPSGDLIFQLVSQLVLIRLKSSWALGGSSGVGGSYVLQNRNSIVMFKSLPVLLLPIEAEREENFP